MDAFTNVPSVEPSMETCFVCGSLASTKEHIFPKWLQHEFNLWDQKLTLPNNTLISYRQLLVSACKRCNNEVFGQLENKIQSRTETDIDIWKWANKIHFALTLKDKFLAWDRKNPNYAIGDVFYPEDPLELSRHFLHCVSGDFSTEPNPYGSVFKFEFSEPQGFDFIHIINSSSIYICLNDRAYVVFIRDGQFIKTRKIIAEEYRELKKKKINKYDMLFFYAKNLEYLDRYKISFSSIISKGSILNFGSPTIREEKPTNKPLLSAICERFGFTWVDADSLK